MARLTWLHLSDWHQKDKDFDRQVVCDALIRDISNRTKIDHNLAQIDFIVFSGDVAFSGKATEYQAAKEYLFDPVLKATSLSAERLFIVPGNHDLDRDWVSKMLPSALQKVLNEEECKSWLTDEEERGRLLEPFKAFSAFVSNYTSQDSPEYASIRMWSDLGGKKVALLGLNSAWMCGRNKDANEKVNDYGYTLLGEPQIHDALAQIANADVRLVVLHHSFDWLTEFDRHRVEERLGKAVHFILCGHQHFPQIKITRGTSGDCVSIPAGASYERRTAINPRYTNAYNFVSLDLSVGKGIVCLRRWSDQRNEWIEDIGSCDGGKYEFDLPKNLCVSKPIIGLQSEPSMNLEIELDAFKKIATGEDTQTRLILVTGEGGMGKSYLLDLYKQVADENNIDVLPFSLGPQISVENCIDQIVSRFGCEHFHGYDEFLINYPHKPLPPIEEEAWQRNLTRQVFKDLGDCINASPLVIFFDQYEKADQLLKNWLTRIFLPYISVRYPIIVVVSGRDSIEPPPSEKGCRHFPLKGVTVDRYHRYVEDCKVKIDSNLVTEFHKLLHGRPKEFVEYVKSQQGAVQ
jgi:predicted phosphodiesterase